MQNSETKGIVRKIDDSGRIVIPKEFRDTLNFRMNEKLEILLVGKEINLNRLNPDVKINGIVRELDNLGRIVVPKEFRKVLKFNNQEDIEISLVDNKVVLSKSNHSCLECGTEVSTPAYCLGLQFCDHCVDVLSQKISKLKNTL